MILGKNKKYQRKNVKEVFIMVVAGLFEAPS
jgi:hypothetical protein